jgi:type II secretory pathway pseudopilin PulG
MQRNRQAFTLIEIAIAVFILLMLLLLAVPSLNGVLANRRLQRSLDAMNSLVRTAQERSVADRRPYLILWDKDRLVLRTEAVEKGEDPSPTAILDLHKGDAFLLKLPAALTDDPPAEWIFWPSGTCEPAIVSYKGVDGSWTAYYSSLTARPELSRYVAK